jgi:hypothetical protein
LFQLKLFRVTYGNSVSSLVLNRVKCFLPEMELANRELAEEMKSQPASSFDIETVDLSCPHIEMVSNAREIIHSASIVEDI